MNDMDPAYRDIEVCPCSTPGWTHHTGFHAFVADREKRAVKTAEAQIRDLLEEREELLTEIRRLRMGNHPAGRALLPGFPSALPKGATDADVAALREALTERDAEHEGGGARE